MVASVRSEVQNQPRPSFYNFWILTEIPVSGLLINPPLVKHSNDSSVVSNGRTEYPMGGQNIQLGDRPSQGLLTSRSKKLHPPWPA